jgi:Ca2+-binding RTX toxin-like protein
VGTSSQTILSEELAARQEQAATAQNYVVETQVTWAILKDFPQNTIVGNRENLSSHSSGGDGVDINIASVWRMGFTGEGVSIAIYDTALDVGHRDLAANVDLSKLVVGKDGLFVDPTRVAAHGDEHATSVAGIIAATRDGNGLVGIAYGANITPVDIFGASAKEDGYIWSALRHQSKFDITNHSWGFGGAFVVNPLDHDGAEKLGGFAVGAANGRDGLGTLANVAAGNYRQQGLSTETNGLTVDRHVVLVGATDRYGEVASYSSPGASLLIVAPSSGHESGVTTTDVTGRPGYSTGNYTNTFGGTSAATPVLSGVEAVMLEANPNLGWRDVQTILAITARHTGSALGAELIGYESDAWIVNHAATWNGGGMHFSNDYGFGLVDAQAAVMLAASWSFVSPTAGTSRNEAAAAGRSVGAWNVGAGNSHTIEIAIGGHQTIEAMVLDLNDLVTNAANHLSVDLISPTGTVSHLLNGNGADGTTIDSGWRLMSRAFRGEDAYGVWSVAISSADGRDIGSLSSVTLRAFGAEGSRVYFYTNEFAAFWDEERGLLSDETGPVTLNAAAVTGAVMLDLGRGSGSIAGRSLVIDSDTRLHTVVTGSGQDVILGGSASLRVHAGGDKDTVTGGGASDTIRGGGGNDVLAGGNGKDSINGDGGNDTIEGGRGSDTLTGGKGNDTLSYAGAEAGVTVNLGLAFRQGTGSAGKDLISGFENLTGSAFADQLAGDGGANVIRGGGGNDVLFGNGGRDVLIGGDGVDSASYHGAESGVKANLTSGKVLLAAGRSSLIGIENLVGSAFDDALVGNEAPNLLVGKNGDDELRGRAGDDRLVGGKGDDLLVGGAGADQLRGGSGDDIFSLGPDDDGGDRILDFNRSSQADKLGVDKSAFGIGQSVCRDGSGRADFDDYFTVAREPDASDHGQFVYHRRTGELFWDRDGEGGAEAVLIATLVNRPQLRAADFDLFCSKSAGEVEPCGYGWSVARLSSEMEVLGVLIENLFRRIKDREDIAPAEIDHDVTGLIGHEKLELIVRDDGRSPQIEFVHTRFVVVDGVGVVSGAEEERVAPGISAQVIVACAAEEPVVAAAAAKVVLADAPLQGVVAAGAAQQVVSPNAAQHVVRVVSRQAVVEARAEDVLEAGQAISLRVATRLSRGQSQIDDDTGVRGRIGHGIDPGAAVELVGMIAAVDQVVPGLAGDDILAGKARDGVVASAAENLVVFRRGEAVRLAERGRAAADRVVGAAADDRIALGVEDVDGEIPQHLAAIAVDDLDCDRVAGGRLEVELGAVEDAYDAGRRVDLEPAARIVGQRIGQGVVFRIDGLRGDVDQLIVRSVLNDAIHCGVRIRRLARCIVRPVDGEGDDRRALYAELVDHRHFELLGRMIGAREAVCDRVVKRERQRVGVGVERGRAQGPSLGEDAAAFVRPADQFYEVVVDGAERVALGDCRRCRRRAWPAIRFDQVGRNRGADHRRGRRQDDVAGLLVGLRGRDIGIAVAADEQEVVRARVEDLFDVVESVRALAALCGDDPLLPATKLRSTESSAAA